MQQVHSSVIPRLHDEASSTSWLVALQTYSALSVSQLYNIVFSALRIIIYLA